MSDLKCIRLLITVIQRITQSGPTRLVFWMVLRRGIRIAYVHILVVKLRSMELNYRQELMANPFPLAMSMYVNSAYFTISQTNMISLAISRLGKLP